MPPSGEIILMNSLHCAEHPRTPQQRWISLFSKISRDCPTPDSDSHSTYLPPGRVTLGVVAASDASRVTSTTASTLEGLPS